MDKQKIQLSLIGDTAFCFNADDYMIIRSKYRIIGRLIGSTVKWPRNSNFNGLPAIYSPYETQLLIDKGIVQLCKKNFTDVSNERFEKQYEEFGQRNLEAGQRAYLTKRIDDARKKMDQILAGKRKKVAKSGGNPNEVTEQTIIEDVQMRAINEATNTSYIQVPTQEPFEIDFEEIRTVENVESTNYRVFCDLWEKGHWITFGATFGGDFLVYPGEPCHFHASHIIHILTEDEAKSMSIPTFITRTRLSVSVKKFCTFAYVKKETDELCYQTVQWQGK